MQADIVVVSASSVKEEQNSNAQQPQSIVARLPDIIPHQQQNTGDGKLFSTTEPASVQQAAATTVVQKATRRRATRQGFETEIGAMRREVLDCAEELAKNKSEFDRFSRHKSRPESEARVFASGADLITKVAIILQKTQAAYERKHRSFVSFTYRELSTRRGGAKPESSLFAVINQSKPDDKKKRGNKANGGDSILGGAAASSSGGVTKQRRGRRGAIAVKHLI